MIYIKRHYSCEEVVERSRYFDTGINIFFKHFFLEQTFEYVGVFQIGGLYFSLETRMYLGFCLKKVKCVLDYSLLT